MVNQIATATVVSTKWDGSFHRSTIGVELGTDHHGTWLWIPPGTAVSYQGGMFEASPCLRLLKPGVPWSAYFVPADPRQRRPKQLYVDITTPLRRNGQLFTFIDLDLDVEQLDDGEVTVLDQDEFEQHARLFSYPAEVAAMATATCRSVMTAVTDRHPPFDGAHLPWQQQAQRL